jgi:hypothetical protein
MLNIRNIMITAIFASFALGACATDRNSGSNNAPEIRSTQELESYLQTTPDSPLNRLPVDVRQSFLNSLRFNENGLSSYRYTDLKALPAADVAQILGLFGIGHTTSLLPKNNTTSNFNQIEDQGGIDDKYCFSAGSCAPMSGWTCTDNC